MRATINIPDSLLSEVQNLSGEKKSKTKAVLVAMQEYVKQKKIKKLISMRGQVQINYDWEKEEELEIEAQKEREKYL